jgi:hypothetical protein
MPTRAQSKSSASDPSSAFLGSSKMTVAHHDELNASFQQLYALLLGSKDIIAKATDPSDLAYKGVFLDFVSTLPSPTHSERNGRNPSRIRAEW